MARKHPLRQYREKEGLSQEALAERLGVTGMTVYRWETGARLPRRKDWPKIENETGVSVTTLLRYARPIAGAA